MKAKSVFLCLIPVLLTGCASILSLIDSIDIPSIDVPALTNGVVTPPPVVVPTNSVNTTAVPWDKATLASLWNGNNAEQRMMNILSPKFSDAKFEQYLKWQKDRGCNTVDLILSNKGDGEGSGYCIYGTAFDWSIDYPTVATMLKRILRCRDEGMAVNIWCMTDDSSDWNKTAMGNPTKYVDDIVTLGFLKSASSVCIGLELTEYATREQLKSDVVRGQVTAMRDALRARSNVKIATHHNSGRLDYADLGDLVWIQESPGVSEAALGNSIAKARATGRPVRCFEISRNPNRSLCEFALKNGCYAVGNW